MRPSFWRRIRNSLSRSPHRRRATIDMTVDGFAFTIRRREHLVRWDEISRTDAGIRDYFTFDGLYLIIFAARTLELDELDDGFLQFENAIFARWPNIKDRVNRLLAGVPHEPHCETIWRRES